MTDRIVKDISNEQPLTKKTEEILKKGRRYFGSSGASLTHPCYNPAYTIEEEQLKFFRIGLDGERKTTKILKKWIKNKPNTVLIDSVSFGTGPETFDEAVDEKDTDHVIVIGHKIILLDSKAWKEKTTYKIDNQGVVMRANKHFKGGHVRANQAKALWLKELKDFPVEITSFVVITNEGSNIIRNLDWWTHGFKLVNHKNLEEWLDKECEDILTEDDNMIDTNLIAKILSGMAKPYDPYRKILKNTLDKVN